MLGIGAQERVKVDSTTLAGKIIMMDPKFVDASALPLTSVESLHSTGTPQSVDLPSWRLTVSGKGVTTPLSLTYDELWKLPMVKKRVLLICPGFFYDYLEWEGVPLQVLLEKAGAGDYARVVFTSIDGYRADVQESGGPNWAHHGCAQRQRCPPSAGAWVPCPHSGRGRLRRPVGEIPDRDHLGVDRRLRDSEDHLKCGNGKGNQDD